MLILSKYNDLFNVNHKEKNMYSCLIDVKILLLYQF